MRPDTRELPRRSFVKAAVALGGTSALAACVERLGTPDVDRGPSDLSSLPTRQHAWNAALSTDEHGNVIAPRHHVLQLLDLQGGARQAAAAREVVESTLQGLERAYTRGNDGLVFALGYSPAYFERIDATPAGVDLPEPRALASFEEPALDRQDAVLHLASDHAQVLLAAEAALWGERDELNGVELGANFGSVFERNGRRTGFVGSGLPADHQDVRGIPDSEPVPDESPLYMGFKSGFRQNQASENRVTIPDGPFAGGTTMQVSQISLSLDQWYEQDSRFQRVGKMFCPVHAEGELVEGTGENLGDSSRMGDCPAHTGEHARTAGMVGHSQKSARARRNDEPLILRRDFDSTDGDEAGLHFVSLQRSIGDFVETREAMNGTDLVGTGAVGQRTNNGILQYMTVKRRGNFLVPPRARRSLPEPG